MIPRTVIQKMLETMVAVPLKKAMPLTMTTIASLNSKMNILALEKKFEYNEETE